MIRRELRIVYCLLFIAIPTINHYFVSFDPESPDEWDGDHLKNVGTGS